MTCPICNDVKSVFSSNNKRIEDCPRCGALGYTEEYKQDPVRCCCYLNQGTPSPESTEIARLRTLIKQVFDLQYDNMSWCEFEKQVLNEPPAK